MRSPLRLIASQYACVCARALGVTAPVKNLLDETEAFGLVRRWVPVDVDVRDLAERRKYLYRVRVCVCACKRWRTSSSVRAMQTRGSTTHTGQVPPPLTHARTPLRPYGRRAGHTRDDWGYKAGTRMSHQVLVTKYSREGKAPSSGRPL